MKKSILSLLVICSSFIISCEEDDAKLTPELKMENSMAANKDRDVKRSYALDSDHSVIEWKGHSQVFLTMELLLFRGRILR